MQAELFLTRRSQMHSMPDVASMPICSGCRRQDRERLTTLGLALAALAAFLVLFGPRGDPADEEVMRPLSTESGPNGYKGAMAWLQQQGVTAISLQERYSVLDTGRSSPRGNLLITTMPHSLLTRPAETRALQRWIQQGNSLLILAALTHTPEWSMPQGYDPSFLATLSSLTGLQFSAAPAEVDESTAPGQAVVAPPTRQDLTVRLAKPAVREFIPAGQHPLVSGVATVESTSEFPASEWMAAATNGVALGLLESAEGEVPSLWLQSSGSGQIVVSTVASPFANKSIGAADNARLLANLVAWLTGSQGSVYFDDAHQGLVAFYDPQSFFGDPRLHRTLAWLLFLWLVFVLATQRMRPMRQRVTAPDITAFVARTGEFFARVLQPAETAKRMFANYFNTLAAVLPWPRTVRRYGSGSTCSLPWRLVTSMNWSGCTNGCRPVAARIS